MNDVFTANPFSKSTLAEQALYDGFVSDADKSKCMQVRSSTGEEIARSGIVFDDSRLNDILFRYRARNYPESLSYEEQEQWHEYRVKVLTEPGFGSLTLDELHELIFSLQESGELSMEKIQLLDDVSNYSDMIL